MLNEIKSLQDAIGITELQYTHHSTDPQFNYPQSPINKSLKFYDSNLENPYNQIDAPSTVSHRIEDGQSDHTNMHTMKNLKEVLKKIDRRFLNNSNTKSHNHLSS